MEQIEIIYMLIFFALIAIVGFSGYRQRKEMNRYLYKRIKKNFGNTPERLYTSEELKNIAGYFETKKKSGFFIDDITYNDLDLEEIFKLLNNTYSCVGEEYLYKMLRMPEYDEKELKERDKIISHFEENNEEAYKLSKIFSELIKNPKISFYDLISRTMEIKKLNPLIDILCVIMVVVSIGAMIYYPPVGVLLSVAVLAFNVFSYFSRKAQIENYILCFKYIIAMVDIADKISKQESDGVLNEYYSELKKDVDEIKSIKKGMFLLSSGGMSGSITDIIMDYVRMILHVDLIKFNSMLKKTLNNRALIDNLYEKLGYLESCIAVASFRKSLSYYCKPVFSDKNSRIKCDEVYHPVIAHPIANDIYEEKCVLITGSNASGKSTFLRTIAINALFAQTIYTCTANEFETCFYEIYSSMALKDSLSGSDSYYMVEIKSLKRILDRIDGRRRILCFVDEVLRGTNTIERIAASSHILKHMSDSKVMCFAATHDIELTHILEDIYSNYHFTEEVEDGDVMFSYKLIEGEATSRNAIKLLDIMGYDENITKSAEKMAYDFVKNGNWTKCY